MAKIGVRCTGGQHQVVERQSCARSERYLPRTRIDPDNLVHEDLRVGLASEDGSNGLRNVGWRQHSQRYLVKQRLKSVVVPPIEDGYLNWQVSQRFGSIQASKPPTNDDHTGAVVRRA
jgi:hypothetical protein